MKPNRDVIRSVVAGVRAIAIIMAGLFFLASIVLWHQTQLSDNIDFGSRGISGTGFKTPFGGSCTIEITTLYEKWSEPRNYFLADKVVDRSFNILCSTPLGGETEVRLIASRGFLEFAYCWFIPRGVPVMSAKHDLHLLSFYTGFAPNPFRLIKGARRVSIPPFAKILPPPPVLVGKGVKVHLLVVAFLFGVLVAVPLYRGPVRRWYRARRGRCIGCGYDLTGNVSGVCPECGRLLA